MHEFAFASDIFEIVKKTAYKYKAKKVSTVFLEIGALTLIVPELLKESFKIVTIGSIVEEALLDIEIIPGQIRCMDCDSISNVKITKESQLTGLQLFQCEKCNSMNTRIIEGKKVNIKNIRIQE